MWDYSAALVCAMAVVVGANGCWGAWWLVPKDTPVGVVLGTGCLPLALLTTTTTTSRRYVVDGPLGGRWSGRGGILCRGFPTGCSPASTAVEHAASFNLRLATGAPMVTGRNMRETSDGGQLTNGSSGGQGTTSVASTRRGLCGGWYGGHEGILCRGFPTGQPPALDRSRTDASGAAAIMVLWKACDGGQCAISRTVPAALEESATRMELTTMVRPTTMMGCTTFGG